MSDATNSGTSSGDDDVDVHDVLEAFNAEEIVDRAGEPAEDVESPANDADAQAPG